jgi:hypothetical protein
MGIVIGHYPDEERLDLTLEGNLDLTLCRDLLGICDLVDDRVNLCVIDATRVMRIFDSGIGLLMMLFDRLQAAGVTLIMLGDISGMPESVTARLHRPVPGAGRPRVPRNEDVYANRPTAA